MRMRRSAVVALATASVLTLSGCGFHGLYGVSLPGGTDLGSHPYAITVYFANVLDLVPESSVKVNDVAIGRVESVKLTDKSDIGKTGEDSTVGWTAKVRIKVRGDVHLPSNSRAAVQMTSLLGEKFVALLAPRGTPTTTDLKNNSTIPLNSPNCVNGCTTTAPEVEEVLGSLSLLLNGGGLQQIHTITTELNKALDGNEAAVRDLLDQLNNFVGQLDVQKDTILTTLDKLDALSTTLAKQTKTLADTLDTLPQALAVLASERSKLTELLTSLSHLGSVAGNVIDATSLTLTRALTNLSPALEQLAAAGSDLPRALRIAGSFPFPLGKSLEAVRGDYANLHLFLDLSLTNELCGINAALCLTSGAGGGLLNGLTSSLPSGASQSSGATKTSSVDSAVIQPTLVGLGG